MTWRWSLATVTSGVVLQLCGLGLDAWLHAHDATLAAREDIFTLANPGHALVLAGLLLTVIGVSAAIAAPRLQGRQMLPFALGALVMVAVAAGGVSWSGEAGGHTHPAPEETRHTHGAGGVSISWEQLRDIEGMLTAAKAATEKYRDVALARADGYRPTTPVLYGVGAHWVNQSLLDEGIFDITRPQVLLYDYGPDGGLELVGVSWALPQRPGEALPPYFAPLAHWHEHSFARSCIGTRGADLFQTLPLDEASCRATGYVFFREEPWFLHAWLFRPSPEGIFSHTNSTLQ
jgi:hypothetical protein